MYPRTWARYSRRAIALLFLVAVVMALSATTASAQTLPQMPGAPGGATQTAVGMLTVAADGQTLPTIWYLIAAGLALLVPAGFVLLAAAGMEQSQAWNTVLGALGAAGLAAVAYWATGFALHFGGVGLVYPHPELHGLVLEWSPLSSDWGIGWGMAGLSGWFLSGGGVTALAFALFLSHLPWVMLGAALPVMSLRGRAPFTITLLISLVLGGIIVPLAGNWVQGGGWLNALGRNLELGHGFVDVGGAGSVHLVIAGFALAALTVWPPQRSGNPAELQLPPTYRPLQALMGGFLLLGGSLGWLYANPLQSESLGSLGLMRGAVSLLLSAAAGLVVPLLYTWFVTGGSDPGMTARGVAAGLVAGLAGSPFVQPGIALLIGFAAGGALPFVTHLLDSRLRIADRTGIVATSGVAAMIGLLMVGLFADGSVGAGWQQTGIGNYLGVSGQGVSGLTVASGFQVDFPGQVQAQVIGIASLALWGFLSGLLVCVPLGMIAHSLLQQDNEAPQYDAPQIQSAPQLVGTSVSAAVRSGGVAELAASPVPLLSADRPAMFTSPARAAGSPQPVAQADADPFASVPYAYGTQPGVYMPVDQGQPAALPADEFSGVPDTDIPSATDAQRSGWERQPVSAGEGPVEEPGIYTGYDAQPPAQAEGSNLPPAEAYTNYAYDMPYNDPYSDAQGNQAAEAYTPYVDAYGQYNAEPLPATTEYPYSIPPTDPGPNAWGNVQTPFAQSGNTTGVRSWNASDAQPNAAAMPPGAVGGPADEANSTTRLPAFRRRRRNTAPPNDGMGA